MGHARALATDKVGLCVIKKALNDPQIFSELNEDILPLMQDPYGNYAIQILVEIWMEEMSFGVMCAIRGKVAQLCIQKYASNVIEKCLKEEAMRAFIVDELIHHLRDCNIHVRLNDEISTINKFDDGKVVCKFKSGKSIAVDTVLFAAGRQGVTDDLSLEKVGIEADNRGRIPVNDDYQTVQPHIYAAGDVIGFPSLASTSMEQGRHAACHAFGASVASQPELFPYGIYAVPEISMVGLTEQECNQRGIAYEVGIARFRETARGQIIGLREGMLKMLFSIETQKLLGVHIIGEGATELVHIGQAVISLGGTLDYFVQTVFNYPTLAEGYKVAALDAYNRMTF